MMARARKKTGTSAKRGASPAALCGMEEVEYVLRRLPGAEFRKKFNGVSFFVGAKVFAFPGRDGVVMKLPAERINTLLLEREARRLVMGKRMLREWVVVVLPPGGLQCEVELLREAMRFVVEGGVG